MENKDLQLKRLKRVTVKVALFVVCGILYAVLIHFTGVGIPCVFYELTGFKCGGCGITRGLIALLHFDFYTMIQYNMFLPIILIYILSVFINTSKEYILNGKFILSAGREWINVLFLVLLLVWSAARNIFGI